MTLEWKKSFIKSYQKLPQHIQKQTDQKLGFLLENFNHPSLRVKKLQGSLRGKKVVDIYELSVTMSYRLLFEKTSDAYILLIIGTHDEILGK